MKKALATVRFERKNRQPALEERGSHMVYPNPLGNVLTRDPCVVTNYW